MRYSGGAGGEGNTSGKHVDYQARINVYACDRQEHRQPEEHGYKHRD